MVGPLGGFVDSFVLDEELLSLFIEFAFVLLFSDFEAEFLSFELEGGGGVLHSDN